MPDSRLLSEEGLAQYVEDNDDCSCDCVLWRCKDVNALLAHIAAVTEQRDEAVKALRRVAYWPFDVMETPKSDLARIKEFAAAEAARLDPPHPGTRPLEGGDA